MTTTPIELVGFLRGPMLRVRTGLWLAAPIAIDRAVDEAARLGVAAADARQPLLDALLPDQTRLGLSHRVIIRALDAVAGGDFRNDCCLVYHLDLLLAGLSPSARADVWESLYSGFPHRGRGLLFMMPTAAGSLLPDPGRLDQWRREGRLAE